MSIATLAIPPARHTYQRRWTLRISWRTVGKHVPFPPHTFDYHFSRDDAVHCARIMSESQWNSPSLVIVRLEVQGPGSDDWQLCFDEGTGWVEGDSGGNE